MPAHFKVVFQYGYHCVEPTDPDVDYSKFTKVELLKRSIEKWEFIQDYIQVHPKIGRDYGLDGGTTTCACCRKYFQKSCKGCPIKAYTHKKLCEGTPYFMFAEPTGYATIEQLIAAAQDEIDFLKKVLARQLKLETK